jgi:hypothetical protein
VNAAMCSHFLFITVFVNRRIATCYPQNPTVFYPYC